MRRAAALPCQIEIVVGRRCRAAQTSIPRPMNLMHASKIRPILRTRHQSSPHGILADVLPFVRVTFTVTQAVMKTTGLKFPRIGQHFRQPVFPETHPAFDGEFQIARGAKQMQMIRHQQIIAHEPSRGRVLPDVRQSPLNRSLRQPAFTFLGANGEENPVRPVERSVNTFGWRATAGLAERRFAHGHFLWQ